MEDWSLGVCRARIPVVLAAAAILLSCTVTGAGTPSGSWPMYGAGPGHDGLSSCNMPSTLSLLWEARTGGPELTSPVAAAGMVIAGSADGNIYCQNASTGKDAWRFDMGENVSAGPAIEGTSLFAISEGGRLCALDVAGGGLLWEASMPPGASYSLPLVIENGELYVTTASGGIIKCSVPRKGAIDWQADAGAHLSSPVTVGQGMAVAVADGGKVYAYHASFGTEAWSIKKGLGGTGNLAPVLADGRLILGSRGKDLFCFGPADGDPVWNATVKSTISSSPAAGYGIVVLCTANGEAVAFNLSTGDVEWTAPLGANVSAPPAMAAGRVYMVTDEGSLVALDASDGKIAWRMDGAGAGLSAPAISEGRLLLATPRGGVMAFGGPRTALAPGGPAPLPAPVVAASATLAVLGIAGACLSFTEFGKYRLLSLLIAPLYVRLKKNEVLDNYTRGQIHGYIIANPGDHYNSIRDALELSNGILAHHLKTLEREGLVQSMRDGMYRRFFPANAKLPPEDEGHLNIQRRILSVIRQNPGISQKEISMKVGVSGPTVNYHVSVLASARMIRVEKEGRLTHCFVVEQ